MAEDYSSLEDAQLAGLAQVGDLAAFEELVSRHEQGIYRFALQICRSEHAAAEVTQDTFVRAFQAIAQYRVSFAFRGWLFAIARSRAMDFFRRNKPPSEPPLPEPVSDDNPAESLARADSAAFVWQIARSKLPEATFQTLWLRYAEDMDIDQIAQVLHKTKTHVKVMLFRARRALATELKASENIPQTRPQTPGTVRLATARR